MTFHLYIHISCHVDFSVENIEILRLLTSITEIVDDIVLADYYFFKIFSLRANSKNWIFSDISSNSKLKEKNIWHSLHYR
jgi:hypothetical protein